MVLVCGYHAAMINDGLTGSRVGQGSMFLPETEFGDDDPCMMTVEVGPDGVRVESICCAATMSEETARELRIALERWLAHREELRNGEHE